MAIHWKQIKGAAEPRGSSASNVILYSFIVFPKYNSDASGDARYKYPPQFFTSNQRAVSPEYGVTNENFYDLGFFALTKYSNSFTVPQNFDTTINIRASTTYYSSLWQDGSILRLGCAYFYWNQDLEYTNALTNNLQAILRFRGNLYINSVNANTGNVTIDSSCKAAFFQATSDKRAKTDIMRVSDQECLNFVKNIEIYTFKYKNINQHSIGVIAQELLQYDINGFSFVDNIEATGENNDYMSIKESKLIYVLLGAVKQLTKEVEDLKAQLK